MSELAHEEDRDEPKGISDDFKICEGISGTWHYHLHRKEDHPIKSLCGAPTMGSSALLSSWGYRSGHISSSYCLECEKISILGKDSPISQKLFKHSSNFVDQGYAFLVRCPECDKENYAMMVASGCCAFCGWDAQPESP